MANLSRILAIVLTGASLSFLGVVCVMIAGGPNWEAEMRSIPGYVVETSSGDVVEYSAKSTTGQAAGGRSRNPAKAIIAARKALQQAQGQELRDLQERTDALKPRLAQIQAWIETDQAAMDRTIKVLSKDLSDTMARITEVSDEIEALQESAIETFKIASRRRDDVYFQDQTIAEIRADHDRHVQLLGVLRDRLLRIESAIDRLRSRREQLANRLTPTDTTASANDRDPAR